jgi:hypothetical protein
VTRDQESFDMILKVLHGNGNMLLPVETTGVLQSER